MRQSGEYQYRGFLTTGCLERDITAIQSRTKGEVPEFSIAP